MDQLINDLSTTIKSNDEEAIVETLKRLQLNGTTIELNDNKVSFELFKMKSTKIIKPFLELLAEWCKLTKNRTLFTDQNIINYLLDYLENINDEVLVMNSIRVLGNICYENEAARKLIGQKGLEIVIRILQTDNERTDNSLTLKACGFLVNLLMSNDELQRQALKFNIIEIIEKLLEKYEPSFDDNKLLITFLLTILNHCVDYLDEENLQFNENLCLLIVKIFKRTQQPEICVTCLEILHDQSDKDNIKFILAKNGICELIYELIEKYRNDTSLTDDNEESRSVMKMACDMIVIILTGDDCMNLLYDNGDGKVYQYMVKWLNINDTDLLSTGILAIGNFARKDLNCIQMVQNGISKKLIELLRNYNKINDDIKVQHALLSTMKNLVIPQQNKAQILQEGLIDAIYPMIQLEQYLVIFKLLGTFRMVIDGQESTAIDLLSRRDFIEKLVYWCYNSDHLGVRGEVPRLLSWLIKNCHQNQPLNNLLEFTDSIKCLTEMCMSNHAVMQNESFLALKLLCNAYKKLAKDSIYYQLLIDNNIGKNLNFVINKYSDKMEKHTIANLLELLEYLINESESVKKHLQSVNIVDVLNKLKTNINLHHNDEKLTKIIQQINSF